MLGAGFDTTWFQLAKDAGGRPPYRCLEVDFKEVRVWVRVCVCVCVCACVRACVRACVCVTQPRGGADALAGTLHERVHVYAATRVGVSVSSSPAG